MASFASIISILVLLAVYGYSVPLQDKFQTSTFPTSNFEYTTGKTTVDNINRINAQLMTKEESENIPKVIIPRGYMDKYTFSTPATMESHSADSRESPMYFGKFSASTPLTNIAGVPSSNLPPRGLVGNNLFDATTFRPSTSAEETVTPKIVLPKRGLVGNNLFDTTTFRPSTSAEETVTPKIVLPPRGLVGNNLFDATTFRPSTSAEETVTPKVTLPKRAFESKERYADKSTSAEILMTTPVWGVDSKESTSAERVNIRRPEATTRKSMGIKYPTTSGSAEVERSSEESKIREPTKVTPRIPMKGSKPLLV